jgi:hypothetical protein
MMKMTKAQKAESFSPTASMAMNEAAAIIRPVMVWTHRYCSTPSRMRRKAATASCRSSRVRNSATIFRSNVRRETMMKPA